MRAIMSKDKTFNDFLDEVAKEKGWKHLAEMKKHLQTNAIVSICTEAAQLYSDYCVEKAVNEIVAMYVPDGNPEQWLNKIQELNKPKP
jgi:hypothetical protein